MKKNLLSGALFRSTVVACVLLLGLAAFQFSRFYGFHERVRRLISGDYQGVAKIQVLEGRVKGLLEIINGGSDSVDLDKIYFARLAEIKKDLDTLKSGMSDRALGDIDRILERAGTLKRDAPNQTAF
ncbi:MAG TPA: hypothetical protein PLH57_10510 [Oligoflexia bacterium]|nr:hypothetical protein [Oligoflexia bacterium]